MEIITSKHSIVACTNHPSYTIHIHIHIYTYIYILAKMGKSGCYIDSCDYSGYIYIYILQAYRLSLTEEKGY